MDLNMEHRIHPLLLGMMRAFPSNKEPQSHLEQCVVLLPFVQCVFGLPCSHSLPRILWEFCGFACRSLLPYHRLGGVRGASSPLPRELETLHPTSCVGGGRGNELELLFLEHTKFGEQFRFQWGILTRTRRDTTSFTFRLELMRTEY